MNSLHKKGPARAIAFNRTLSPAANVGVKRVRRGGTSVLALKMPLHVLHHRTCCLNRLRSCSQGVAVDVGLCRSAPSALRVSFASESNAKVWRFAPTT